MGGTYEEVKCLGQFDDKIIIWEGQENANNDSNGQHELPAVTFGIFTE